jgi:hypothetical protein
MDVAPSRGPQRVGKGYIAMPSGGGIHAIKISASLTQDLVGLTELAVLSLQGLELGGHVRGQARLAPAVSLGPANPLMQRLRRAADLRGNRSHRRPPRGMILLVLENQPNRKRAHFRRKSVRCLACHRSTFSRLGASGKPGAVQSTFEDNANTVFGTTNLLTTHTFTTGPDVFAGLASVDVTSPFSVTELYQISSGG